MRTALLLLLLLAIAAVPGSLVPQRSSDPNGVTQYFADNPELAPVLDGFQMFDVYTSAWFSAVYLLLFVSLIGCVIPRTKHHFEALRARPPRTPARLVAARRLHRARRCPTARRRMPRSTPRRGAAASARATGSSATTCAARHPSRPSAATCARPATSSSTPRCVGVLVAVGFGGGFGFAGQRVVVEGQTFVNTLAAYDSFNPGRFFDDTTLDPYRLSLDEPRRGRTRRATRTRSASRSTSPRHVTVQAQGGDAEDGARSRSTSRSASHGTDVYLLGNGYAPTITVRDADGEVVFTDSVPFLPQDANLTSIGVVKVPDGLDGAARHGRLLLPDADDARLGRLHVELPRPRSSRCSRSTSTQGDLGIDGGDADLGVHARPVEHGAAHRRHDRRRLDRAHARRDAPTCRTASARSPSRT